MKYALALFIAISSIVLGDYDERLTALEKKVADVSKGINPQYYRGGEIYFLGEALYWQARENGLEYGVEFNDPTFVAYSLNSRLFAPSFNWSWGFRVEAGYLFKRDGWDLSLGWLRYHPSTSSNATITAPSGLFPIWVSPSLNTGYATSASTDLSIRVDLLTLPIGRAFYVSKHLTLRPYGGIIGGWIKQSYNQSFSGPAFGFGNVSMNNNFSGAGLLAGLETRWGFGRGFNIFADGSLSLIYGRFKTNRLENNALFGGSVRTLSSNDNFNAIRALTDIDIGIGWNYGINRNRVNLGIDLSYALQLYFGQNQFFRFVNSTFRGSLLSNQGDLSLHGLRMSFSLAF